MQRPLDVGGQLVTDENNEENGWDDSTLWDFFWFSLNCWSVCQAWLMLISGTSSSGFKSICCHRLSPLGAWREDSLSILCRKPCLDQQRQPVSTSAKQGMVIDTMHLILDWVYFHLQGHRDARKQNILLRLSHKAAKDLDGIWHTVETC